MEEYEQDQQAKKDKVEQEEANQAKKAAVDKVISMLQNLQLQVLQEGEAEAATYNKFACFCRTTQKDKSGSIKTGKDDKTSLTADIKKLSKQRDDLDVKISKLVAAIKKAEGEMKKAVEKSNAELAVFKTNDADVKAALSALTEAIKVLKSSKGPSLVE